MSKSGLQRGVLAIAILVVCFGTEASAAATPEQKCQAAKLKAAGKARVCLLKQRANVIVGKADESAECLEKFEAAIVKADLKAAKALSSCRYLDNGDGTITDLDTALMWEKKDDGGGVHDKDNSYSWSLASTIPDGTAFTGFLYGLNGATSLDGVATVAPCFAGHCDWRLPTVQEFTTILNGGICGPCVDAAFGPVQNDYYWSSTTSSIGPNLAFIAIFNGGGVGNVDKIPPGPVYAIAVRGGL